MDVADVPAIKWRTGTSDPHEAPRGSLSVASAPRSGVVGAKP